MCCFRIEGIFNQLLDDGCGALHDLSGRDLVDQGIPKQMDAIRDLLQVGCRLVIRLQICTLSPVRQVNMGCLTP